jgi:hypothetical protein
MLPHLLADKNKIEDYGIMPHMLQSQKVPEAVYHNTPKLRKLVYTRKKKKFKVFDR